MKKEGSKPRPSNFSIVVDARLEELLITTIFAPAVARFFTVTPTTTTKKKLDQPLCRTTTILKKSERRLSRNGLSQSIWTKINCQIISDYVKYAKG